MWALTSLLSSFTTATSWGLNARFKVPAYQLSIGIDFLTFLTTILVAFFVTGWPTSPQFYLLGLLGSLASLGGHLCMYTSAARSGGYTTSLAAPLKVPVVFLLWLLLAGSTLPADTLQRVGILAALTGCVVSGLLIYQDKITARTLLLVLPIALFFSVSDLTARFSSLYATLPQIIFAGLAFGTAVKLLALAPLAYARAFGMAGLAFPGRALAAIGLLYVLNIVTQASNVTALVLSPNPSYFSAIVLLMSVWLFVYERLTRQKTARNPLPGIILLASAATLIFLTA